MRIITSAHVIGHGGAKRILFCIEQNGYDPTCQLQLLVQELASRREVLKNVCTKVLLLSLVTSFCIH